jgi:hypothetical protein
VELAHGAAAHYQALRYRTGTLADVLELLGRDAEATEIRRDLPSAASDHADGTA